MAFFFCNQAQMTEYFWWQVSILLAETQGYKNGKYLRKEGRGDFKN